MKWKIILLSMLLGAVLVPAQEPLNLSLENSIDLALANNPSYQIKVKELKKAKAGITEAYSSIMPQINASASLQKAWSIQENTIPNFIKFMLGPSFPGVDLMPDYVRLSFGLENTLVYGASLSQPLFLGGAGIAGIKMAGSAHQTAIQNLELARQDLLYQTAAAFYGCILADQVVQVREDVLLESEKNLQVVRQKYEAGAASKFDLMRAEVNVANSRPDAISARNNYNNALTLLKMILALPAKQLIQVNGELNFIEDEFTTLTLQDYQQLALQHRPEVEMLEQGKAMAHQGVTIARSAYLPKVFFQTDYSYMGMRNDMEFVQDDFSKGFTSAVSLQLPLFTSFRTTKQYQKARLDYRIAQDAENQAIDGITAEVEASYHNLVEAKEKYASASETVDMATESLRLANMMYEEGGNTQLDVFTAQLGLTSAKMNYLSSLYSYQMARYSLRKVTGQLKNIL